MGFFKNWLSGKRTSSARLVRLPLMAIAALFGMIGISIELMILFIHLISMESLGVPYVNPVSPSAFLTENIEFKYEIAP